MSQEKQIEEMAIDISEATRRASKILVDEAKAFIKENHRYHSKNDFREAHTKTMSELEAEYLTAQGYRKQTEGEWVNNHCSVCGMTPLGEEAWKHLGLTPPKFEYCMDFCPTCGAKMKGANE